MSNKELVLTIAKFIGYKPVCWRYLRAEAIAD